MYSFLTERRQRHNLHGTVKRVNTRTGYDLYGLVNIEG